MTVFRELFERVKGAFLRVYYLMLFSYHLTMYKRAVKDAQGGANSKKLRR